MQNYSLLGGKKEVVALFNRSKGDLRDISNSLNCDFNTCRLYKMSVLATNNEIKNCGFTDTNSFLVYRFTNIKVNDSYKKVAQVGYTKINTNAMIGGVNRFYSYSDYEKFKRSAKNNLDDRFKYELFVITYNQKKIRPQKNDYISTSGARFILLKPDQSTYWGYKVRNYETGNTYYTTAQDLPNFDKSGYYRPYYQAQLNFRLKKFKAEKKRSFCDTYDFTQAVKEVEAKKEQVLQQQKEIINNLDLNQDKSYEVLDYISNSIASNSLRSFINKFNSFMKNVKDKTFRDIETYKTNYQDLMSFECKVGW